MESFITLAEAELSLADPLFDVSLPRYEETGLRKVNVLLVEDVASDALLTRVALEATGVPFTLTRLRRGSEVIPALRLNQRYYPGSMPDLILLDLGLPDASGFDVLEDLARSQPSLRAVPVVILTAHKHFDYLCKTESLLVEGYMNKPCKAEELRKLLNKAMRFNL